MILIKDSLGQQMVGKIKKRNGPPIYSASHLTAEQSYVFKVEKALRVVASPVLQLSEDGKKVTRAEPFKPADKEQVEARTIYVENLPQDADHESLKKVAKLGSPVPQSNM